MRKRELYFNNFVAPASGSDTPVIRELDESWTPHYESLVAYWKLNNNGTDEINGFNLSPTGGVSYSSSVKKLGSHSALFDGVDGYLSVVDLALDSASVVTVHFWTRVLSNPGVFRGFFSCNATDGNDYGDGMNIDMGPDMTTALDYINVECASISGQQNLMSGSVAFDVWAHVVVTKDSENIKLYVNGALKETRAIDSDEFVNMNEFRIGARFYGGSTQTSHFHGYMDDVAVFVGVALPLEDVQTIYNRQVAA